MINLSEFIERPLEIRQQHLDLQQPCCERGGISTNHRGVLAQFLDTELTANKRVLLCHACNNAKCSNPHHLYWGTDGENTADAIKIGSRKTWWENMVVKYGLDEARKLQAGKDTVKAGAGNRGKPKSEMHKKSISEALKKRA